MRRRDAPRSVLLSVCQYLHIVTPPSASRAPLVTRSLMLAQSGSGSAVEGERGRRSNCGTKSRAPWVRKKRATLLVPVVSQLHCIALQSTGDPRSGRYFKMKCTLIMTSDNYCWCRRLKRGQFKKGVRGHLEPRFLAVPSTGGGTLSSDSTAVPLSESK